MPDYRLHCFALSGNAYKVALMLELSRVPWEAVPVDFLGGQTRAPEWRDSLNAMGEAPVLEHGGKRLTQSGAILTYLARMLGTFAPRTPDEEYEVLRWILFDNHKFTSYLATYRFLFSIARKPADPAVLGFLKGRVDAAFAIVEAHLSDRAFIIGDRPTIADLSLAGYVYYPSSETGYDLAASHPAIDAWRQRIAALPGWKHPYDLMPGEKATPRAAGGAA